MLKAEANIALGIHHVNVQSKKKKSHNKCAYISVITFHALIFNTLDKVYQLHSCLLLLRN